MRLILNKSTKKVFHIDKSRSDYSKKGVLTEGANSPPSNPPAAKFISQGDADVRTNNQIKFLYYPLTMYYKHGGLC